MLSNAWILLHYFAFSGEPAEHPVARAPHRPTGARQNIHRHCIDALHVLKVRGLFPTRLKVSKYFFGSFALSFAVHSFTFQIRALGARQIGKGGTSTEIPPLQPLKELAI